LTGKSHLQEQEQEKQEQEQEQCVLRASIVEEQHTVVGDLQVDNDIVPWYFNCIAYKDCQSMIEK
jgi:hypothetical protein